MVADIRLGSGIATILVPGFDCDSRVPIKMHVTFTQQATWVDRFNTGF